MQNLVLSKIAELAKSLDVVKGLLKERNPVNLPGRNKDIFKKIRNDLNIKLPLRSIKSIANLDEVLETDLAAVCLVNIILISDIQML